MFTDKLYPYNNWLVRMILQRVVLSLGNEKITSTIIKFNQEITDCKGTETRQIFTRMFVMAKNNKELFASTLDGIPISVFL